MDSSFDVERFVNRFVESRTGEKICLELANEHAVILKPVCNRGSVSLGIFWIKVFQHTNNFPIYSHSYKKLYHAGSEFELQLRIEGISISINLQTGYLTLKGIFVIDWFVRQIPKILEAYTMQPEEHRKPINKVYRPEEMKTLKEECKRYYNSYVKQWPENALKQNADVMAAGRKSVNREAITEGFLNGEDLESYCPIPDLLDDNELKQQLIKLEKGQAIQGYVIYRLWLSTLNSWFGDQEGKVYIFTPHIDCNCLVDLCKLFLKNKNTACIETFCVPMSSLSEKFANVKSEALKKFLPYDQILIEYRIFSQNEFPPIDFVTSFVALVKHGIAQILVTNINYDRKSFFTLTSASVHYKEIKEKQFKMLYIEPIVR